MKTPKNLTGALLLWGALQLAPIPVLAQTETPLVPPEGDLPVAVPMVAEADAARTMLVKRFIIVGNKAIPEEEIRPLVAPAEGKELTLAQMKALAKNIDTLYQRKGYYLVHTIVPAQDFANNEVRLQVVEGRIGKVTVQGAESYDAQYLKERFEAAVPGGEFRADDFQRNMILMNELPNVKVKSVFKPGQETGTADVILKVEETGSVHADLTYNNYGTRETGYNRVGLGLSASNMITDADEFSVMGMLGFPAKQNNFFEAHYVAPIGMDGLTMSASYANGAFTVSQGLGAVLDVRGDANIYTLGMSYPLERSLDFSSNLGLAISHKDINSNFFGGALPFSKDVYTMARLSYQADFRDAGGRTVLQAAWSQGLGGNSANDPLSSRAGASGSFSKFNLDLARVQTLDTGLYGMLRGSLQVATQPLFVAEQFGMGGPDTVRGYQQAELLGDNAYLVSAELRWSPIEDEPNLFQMAFFFDHGGVSLKRKLPGDLPNGSTLTGAGLGFRFGINDNSNLRLDLGFPISPSRNLAGSSPAVYAGMQTRF